jgi:hypothetical protein
VLAVVAHVLGSNVKLPMHTLNIQSALCRATFVETVVPKTYHVCLFQHDPSSTGVPLLVALASVQRHTLGCIAAAWLLSTWSVDALDVMSGYCVP